MTTPFRATVRYFRPEQGSGLTVVDVPAEVTGALGGLKQLRVNAVVNGQAFVSNTMPAGGGRLALSVSKAMQRDAGVGMGDAIEVEIISIGRD